MEVRRKAEEEPACVHNHSGTKVSQRFRSAFHKGHAAESNFKQRGVRNKASLCHKSQALTQTVGNKEPPDGCCCIQKEEAKPEARRLPTRKKSPAMLTLGSRLYLPGLNGGLFRDGRPVAAHPPHLPTGSVMVRVQQHEDSSRVGTDCAVQSRGGGGGRGGAADHSAVLRKAAGGEVRQMRRRDTVSMRHNVNSVSWE